MEDGYTVTPASLPPTSYVVTVDARAVKEKPSEMNALHHSPQADLVEVAPIVDKATNELLSEDRSAILLRFFESLDFCFIGHALGSTEEAARKLVNRALDKLQESLKTEGVTLSATTLATAQPPGWSKRRLPDWSLLWLRLSRRVRLRTCQYTKAYSNS